MARRASDRGWWQSYPRSVVPGEYGDLISVEAEAATIRTFQPEVVPGLLQTPGYARAVIRAGRRPAPRRRSTAGSRCGWNASRR